MTTASWLTDRSRRDRGSASVQMVLALPLVFALVFLSIQAGLWFYARSIALAAAEVGARSSAARHATLHTGIADARAFASRVGGHTLTGVGVSGSRSASFTTITVTGNVVRLVPFWTPTVTQSATLPVERLT